VITAADDPPRIIATNKDSGQSRVGVRVRGHARRTDHIGASRGQGQDHPRAAGGDQGVRDWMAGIDAKTGKRLCRSTPCRRRARPQRDLEGQEQRLADRRWRHLGDGTYDPATNQTFWGTGNPCRCMIRPIGRATTSNQQRDLYNPDTGNMNWYFQFTPGDMWDFDEVGTHILIDGISRASRASCSRTRRATASSTPWSARNGQTVLAKPTWK